MATRLSRSLFRSSKTRLYSGQTVAKQNPSSSYIPPEAAKVTNVSGITVASIETNAPLCRLAVVLRAGPRHESGANVGISHCLRQTAQMTNAAASEFKIIKEIGQTGGNLGVTTTREYLCYTATCLRDSVDLVYNQIQNITTKPDLRSWEFDSKDARMKMDLAFYKEQPNVRVMELLHKAAYRDTLGRSLYCHPSKIGAFSIDQVQGYMNNYFTRKRKAVVAMGIDHDYLVSMVRDFNPPLTVEQPNIPDKSATFYGGGNAREFDNGLTYAAVATEGPSLSSKDVLPAGVLQMILGTGPFMKYSMSSNVSRLGRVVAQNVANPFTISSFNCNYTDSGLFGFTCVGDASDMDKALKAAFAEVGNITKMGITDAELARGKTQLKAYIAMMMEDGEVVFSDLIEKAMNSPNDVTTLDTVFKKIDSIQATDVNNIAKKVGNGKPSMAVCGDLAGVPYVDQLYK